MSRKRDKSRTPKKAVSWRSRSHAVVDWVFAKLSWAPGVIGLTASGVGAAALAVAGMEEFAGLRGQLLVGGLIASGIGILLLVIVEVARRRAEVLMSQEGAALQLAMTDAMQPALHRLTELVARPSNLYEQQLPKVISSALTSLPILFGEKPKLRMVIFRLEPAKGARQRRLAVVDFGGRGGKQQPNDFVAGDGGRGDSALRWIEEREPKFVPDIETESDPNWKGSGRGYRTFISVPICSESTIFGMLTLDAPEPGDLDETDVPLAVTLAGVLAVAYAAKRG